MAELLLILQAIDALTTAAINWRVDMTKFNELQAKARAEQRALTVDELKALANDAQSAIDAI